jgi:hypothetical protein
MWDAGIRDRAIYLRAQGLSLNHIVSYLKIPKTTVFGWIKGKPYPEKITIEARKVLGKLAQPYGSGGQKQKRQRQLTKIRLDVHKEVQTYQSLLNLKHYRSLLAMLYWAEGAKPTAIKNPSLVFANTDPVLCKLFITLLRESYDVDESKFRIYLYLHYYHDQDQTKKYWSELLNIPLQQFGKIRLKRTAPSRFRANHRGICFIRYYSVDLQYRITHTAFSIADLINKNALVA